MNDRTNAYILKQSDYRENDALVSVLSEDFGLITLIAKGIRKPNSKNSAALYPFSKSELLFDYSEDKDLFVLHSARLLHNDSHIHQDLAKISVCNVLAETLISFKEESRDPYSRKYLYELLEKVLEEISETKDLYLPLSFFLARMLDLAGISPEVDECALCGNSRIQAISIEAGGFVCENCRQSEAADVALLKQFRLLNKAQTQHYDLLKPFGPYKKENAEILYGFLSSYLSLHLKSWKFMEEVIS